MHEDGPASHFASHSALRVAQQQSIVVIYTTDKVCILGSYA